jgi:hypothetical protein
MVFLAVIQMDGVLTGLQVAGIYFWFQLYRWPIHNLLVVLCCHGATAYGCIYSIERGSYHCSTSAMFSPHFIQLKVQHMATSTPSFFCATLLL